MANIIEYNPKSTEAGNFLEPLVQSGHLNFLFGSGASLPAIQAAGNIEKSINKLLEAGNRDTANRRALEFVEKIEAKNNMLIAGSRARNIVDTLKNYTLFLETVDRILFERKNTLLPRQATIFTTNYDTFFEVASEDIASVLLNDGFDRQLVRSMEFTFSPEKYFDRIFRSGSNYDRPNELPGFNLVKMHGSLTWRYQGRDGLVFSLEKIPKLSTQQMGLPAEVEESLEQRAVILPNLMKFGATVLERIYFDLLRLYSNCLEKENALLLVFGFSFADEHILDITRRALRNPTAQVVIFAHTKKDANAYEKRFAQQRNVLIVAPKTRQRIDFPTFNAVLESIVPKPEDSK